MRKKEQSCHDSRLRKLSQGFVGITMDVGPRLSSVFSGLWRVWSWAETMATAPQTPEAEYRQDYWSCVRTRLLNFQLIKHRLYCTTSALRLDGKKWRIVTLSVCVWVRVCVHACLFAFVSPDRMSSIGALPRGVRGTGLNIILEMRPRTYDF